MDNIKKQSQVLTKEHTIFNRLTEPKFEGLYYNNSTPIAIVNQDTTFDIVNDALCDNTGYTRGEFLDLKWTQLVTEDMLSVLKENNEKRLVDPRSFPDDYEITFYNKQGEKQYAQMALSFCLN